MNVCIEHIPWILDVAPFAKQGLIESECTVGHHFQNPAQDIPPDKQTRTGFQMLSLLTL